MTGATLPAALNQSAAIAAGLLLDAGFWIVLSLALGGLIREYLNTERARRAMRSRGPASVVAGMGLGAMLPICSCGVIPLTVSFYLGGARLAAVMAFTVATPVINPAAVVLSYALLGPELTLAYVAFGLTAPLVVGYLTEGWAGGQVLAQAPRQMACCGTPAEPAAAPATAPPHSVHIRRAMRWAFGELGPMLGFYLGIGIVLASVLSVVVPPDWITKYLGGSAPFASLLLIALFGASIYVCAVAHIPLVAALLAAGAGPGAAIVFLVTGAATNLPELLALQRVLGTRIVALYVGSVVALSVFAGWLVNLWLADYRPMLDPLASIEYGDLAARLTPVIPPWLAYASAVLVAALALWGSWNWLRRSLARFKVFGSLQRG